jgi:hypothetical protein
MVFEESPSSDRRSIPALTRSSPEQPAEGRSGWVPILLAGLVAAAVLAAMHAPRPGAAAQAGVFSDLEGPRPFIITEAARRPAQSTTPVQAGVVVPVSAVIKVHGSPTVFVSEADYRFVATPVVLGEMGTDGQQVVSGITAGQVVVTEGAEALRDRLVVQ